MFVISYRKAFVFFLLAFVSSDVAKATHLMGADMQYIHLGAMKYKVVASVYRDCRGIPLGVNDVIFGMYSGNPNTRSCGQFKLTFQRTSITDITPTCNAVSKPCSPVNTSARGMGVELHIYETVVDFDSTPYKNLISGASCCNVTFYMEQCCRNGAITTGASSMNFITYCTLNLCTVSRNGNNSPAFSNPPIFFTCCNQPYRYNHGLIDTVDQDSVVFILTTPLITAGPDQATFYTAPFSYRYPVTPYCPGSGGVLCLPDPKASNPVGFYFDSLGADMIYTPTKCDEVALIAVVAKEYRKIGGNWLEVGSTRRDMQVLVTDCVANMIPEITGTVDTCIQEGDTLILNIRTKDTLVKGVQTRGDSVSISWNGGIKGAVFTVNTGKNPTGTLHWIAPKGSARQQPYTFSIYARDNNCNLNAEHYKGFRVYVGNCGKRTAVERSHTADLKIYPLPVKQGTYLFLPVSAHTAFVLCDFCGRIMYTGAAEEGRVKIPEHIPSGGYLLKTEYLLTPTIQRILIGD